eukprot:scaffold151321_cov21-Tisochrysis_lutea.AAC.3
MITGFIQPQDATLPPQQIVSPSPSSALPSSLVSSANPDQGFPPLVLHLLVPTHHSHLLVFHLFQHYHLCWQHAPGALETEARTEVAGVRSPLPASTIEAAAAAAAAGAASTGCYPSELGHARWLCAHCMQCCCAGMSWMRCCCAVAEPRASVLSAGNASKDVLARHALLLLTPSIEDCACGFHNDSIKGAFAGWRMHCGSEWVFDYRRNTICLYCCQSTHTVNHHAHITHASATLRELLILVALIWQTKKTRKDRCPTIQARAGSGL